MKRVIALQVVSSLILLFTSCNHSTTQQISSPDDRLSVDLSLDDRGAMYYSVYKNNELLVGKSPLGFTETNGVNLSDGFSIVEVERSSLDEVWAQPWGENKEIRNNYNEIVVGLKNNQSLLNLTFKVFNDGVGFRYSYEVSQVDSIYIADELTAFNIVPKATSWSIPANFETYELL